MLVCENSPVERPAPPQPVPGCSETAVGREGQSALLSMPSSNLALYTRLNKELVPEASEIE